MRYDGLDDGLAGYGGAGYGVYLGALPLYDCSGNINDRFVTNSPGFVNFGKGD
jgi:hypothetical protein